MNGRISFTLPVSIKEFEDWFVYQTGPQGGPPPEVIGGWAFGVLRLCPESKSTPRHWYISAHPPEGKAVSGLRLVLIPGGRDIYVSVTCPPPVLEPFFTQLLAAIDQRWPGCLPAITLPPAPPAPDSAEAHAPQTATNLNPGGRPSKRAEHKKWLKLYLAGMKVPEIHKIYPCVKQTTIERRLRELLAEERRKPGENL